MKPWSSTPCTSILLTKAWQIFLFLLLCPVCIYRMHNQRWLNTHDWTITAVHSLDFPCQESISYVGSSCTAIAYWKWILRVNKWVVIPKSSQANLVNRILLFWALLEMFVFTYQFHHIPKVPVSLQTTKLTKAIYKFWLIP